MAQIIGLLIAMTDGMLCIIKEAAATLLQQGWT